MIKCININEHILCTPTFICCLGKEVRGHHLSSKHFSKIAFSASTWRDKVELLLCVSDSQSSSHNFVSFSGIRIQVTCLICDKKVRVQNSTRQLTYSRNKQRLSNLFCDVIIKNRQTQSNKQNRRCVLLDLYWRDSTPIPTPAALSTCALQSKSNHFCEETSLSRVWQS